MKFIIESIFFLYNRELVSKRKVRKLLFELFLLLIRVLIICVIAEFPSNNMENNMENNWNDYSHVNIYFYQLL